MPRTKTRLIRVARRAGFAVAAAVVALLTIRSSVAGVYRVAGPSDAPTLVLGERVLVNHAAYGLRVPFTRWRVAEWSRPGRGDLVLVEVPGSSNSVFKRVVAVAGDTVELRENRLIVNGTLAAYRPIERSQFADLQPRNQLGERVEIETSDGCPRTITFTPGASPRRSFGPVRVPAGQCFVLGDNRDASRDSRSFGPLAFEAITGRVVLSLDRR